MIRLYTCVITHRHGTDVYNNVDPDRLSHQLFEYVVSNWDEILAPGEDSEIPENLDEAIAMYFARHSSEYYEWQEENLPHYPCKCGGSNAYYHVSPVDMEELGLDQHYDGSGWYLYYNNEGGAGFYRVRYCEICGGELTTPEEP